MNVLLTYNKEYNGFFSAFVSVLLSQKSLIISKIMCDIKYSFLLKRFTDLMMIFESHDIHKNIIDTCITVSYKTHKKFVKIQIIVDITFSR